MFPFRDAGPFIDVTIYQIGICYSSLLHNNNAVVHLIPQLLGIDPFQ